jgi:hypothetical protein
MDKPLHTGLGRNLYIHIGMPKSGTKWVQKILGINRQWLDASGIRYTLPEYEQPENGVVLTFGNAPDLFGTSSDIDAVLDRCGDDGKKSLFLSSEKIFRNLLNAGEELRERDLTLLKERGFSRIIFLVFVRSPLENLSSQINQYCKLYATLDISEERFKALEEKDMFGNLDSILSSLNRYENIELNIVRYDATGKQLIPLLSSLLGVDQKNFILPAFPRANRSHSYEELHCLNQLRISGFDQDQLGNLSRAWMAALPDLEVKPLYPSLDFQRGFWERNERTIQRINKWLPAAKQFTPEYYEPFTPPTQPELSTVQQDILNQFLSEYSGKNVS